MSNRDMVLLVGGSLHGQFFENSTLEWLAARRKYDFLWTFVAPGPGWKSIVIFHDPAMSREAAELALCAFDLKQLAESVQ